MLDCVRRGLRKSFFKRESGALGLTASEGDHNPPFGRDPGIAWCPPPGAQLHLWLALMIIDTISGVLCVLLFYPKCPP